MKMTAPMIKMIMTMMSQKNYENDDGDENKNDRRNSEGTLPQKETKI